MRISSLALVALLVAGCSSGSDGTEATTTGPDAAQVVTVGMTDGLDFDPATVRARPGKVTLTVTNRGKVPHDLKLDDGLGATDVLNGGRSAPLTVSFDAPGTYTFVCTLHPGMDGKVVVAAPGSP